MRVESSQTETLTIYDAGSLDPVTVFLQDFGGGQGRLTIECWGRSWSAYWGAMSGALRAFVLDAHTEYIANKLESSAMSNTAKTKERAYLERIVLAVKAALQGSAS